MKISKHLLFILISLVSVSTLAQTTKKSLNYQAVILDPKAIDIPGASITGQPLNKGNVCLRFSLLNAQGGLDYEETQQVTTDEFGLVSVAIGTGSQGQTNNSTSIYKSFESIVWNASVKSLKVSVSYDGCSSFKQVSTQALNYTPYALYAEAVDYKNVREAPTKLSQFSNDAGFLIPKDLDPLKIDIQANSSKIATANQTIADNKQASDAAFLVMNQSITSLDKQVADNTSSITSINTKLTDQQSQISDNRNQLAATTNTMNAQIGGLQGQLNVTNSTVNNLSGAAEVQSNKSTAVDLGGSSPSDQSYPSQKATKSYVDQALAQVANGTISDATTLVAGKVQLAGDLGGTATSPTVPALANKENTANKSTNVLADGTNDTKYPSVKAVKDYVDQATYGTALAADLAGKANIASPTFTGTPTAPTPASSDNSTKLATTAFVQAATAGIALQAAVDAKADKNSPTFTGTPVLPTGTTGVTQTSGDNSTKLATTAYVDAQVASGAADATSSTNGIIRLTGDLGGSASSPSVVKLRGTAISSVAPVTAGHVLTYDASGSGVAYWAAPANSANTISGVVPVANGGTGLSSLTSGGAIYASSSSALTTGTLPLTAGGTGAISQQAAINALTGTQSAGKYLRSDGTNAALSTIQAADIPTLNQNTTGTADNVTGIIGVANGGTGLSSLTSGGAIYASSSSALTTGTLPITAGGTGSTTKNFVDLTNAQSISGVKSFTNNASFKGVSIGYGNATGGSNVGVGPNALNAVSTGHRNTALGAASMLNYVGSGYDNNTSVGYSNLSGLTTGSGNTSVGAESMLYLLTGTNNTSIGNQSLMNITGSGNVGMGYSSGSIITDGSNNTVIGYAANVAGNSQTNSTALGNGAIAGASNSVQLGNTNVTNVKTSGTITAGAVTYPNVDGTSGQFISTNGSGTLSWTTLGIVASGSKVAIGSSAGLTSQSASTVAVGSEAGSASQGQYAVALGGGAGKTNQGSSSIAIGYVAGYSGQGNQSVAIGSNAAQAGQGIKSVAIGYTANSSANNATAIGGNASASHTNATAIGFQAASTADNTIQLGADGVTIAGSTAITNVKTSGTLTAGTVTYPNTHGTSGQVLTTTGSGTLTWAAAANSGGSGTYSIGLNNALGGYVVYVTPDGKHGLVSETIDQVRRTPGQELFRLPYRATDPANHSTAGKNFIDWRIPNFWEFSQINLYRSQIGGFDDVNWGYFFINIPTNNQGITDWIVYVGGGDFTNVANGSNVAVRTVRSF